MRRIRTWPSLILISFILIAIFYGFTNCASFESLKSATLASGTDFCHGRPGDAACVTPVAATCQFDGQVVPEGKSVGAFLNSTPAAGGACVTEMRTCHAGALSGSYGFATCGITQAAACLFNGRTIPDGQSVTAYRASTGATCVPEVRTCARGLLAGSFAFASCLPTAPAACLFNGQTIAHGTSVVAYAVANVPAGGACVPSVRTCLNGALTGVGDFGSCAVSAARACVFDGRTLADGSSVPAFATGNVPYGQTCNATTRVCRDGTLSGAGDFASCVVNQPASCLLNGLTIPNGGGVILYTIAQPDSDGRCPTENRVCANGVLTGSATQNSCSLPSPDDGAPVVLLNTGATFAHQIGHVDANGSWTATAADGVGYMAYGPYLTTLAAAPTLARFKLAIDNGIADDDQVAVLDVFDSTAGQALNTRALTRQDFLYSGVAQNFSVDFVPPAGHAIEFRVQALGRAALTHASTEVRAEGLQRDMLLWIDSGIDESEYVAVHFEQRQCDPPYDACGPWTSGTSVFQPFKSRWDNANQRLYWRKDDFDHDFYGEVWNLTTAGLTLRQETMPYLPDFDPKGASDDWAANGWIDPGRFRLFSLDPSPAPGGAGRVLAPRYLDWNFSLAQTLNTYRCYSWAQFAQAQCPIYQANFQDTKISVDVIDDFSSDFDGANQTDAQTWVPVPEFRSFERAVVMNQEMFGRARERFFFAERAGRYYGIVRWDNSVYDPARNRWIVWQRTLGVKRKNDHHVTFDGMVARGLKDRR